jgi:hypothetical protein
MQYGEAVLRLLPQKFGEAKLRGNKTLPSTAWERRQRQGVKCQSIRKREFAGTSAQSKKPSFPRKRESLHPAAKPPNLRGFAARKQRFSLARE